MKNKSMPCKVYSIYGGNTCSMVSLSSKCFKQYILSITIMIAMSKAIRQNMASLNLNLYFLRSSYLATKVRCSCCYNLYFSEYRHSNEVMKTLCTNTYCKNRLKISIWSVTIFLSSFSHGLIHKWATSSNSAPTIATYNIIIVTFRFRMLLNFFTVIHMPISMATVATVINIFKVNANQYGISIWLSVWNWMTLSFSILT